MESHGMPSSNSIGLGKDVLTRPNEFNVPVAPSTRLTAEADLPNMLGRPPTKEDLGDTDTPEGLRNRQPKLAN